MLTHRHLRSNAIAFLAVLIVLTAALPAGVEAAGLAKDAVKSRHIKNGAIKRVDLRTNAVDATKIASNAVGTDEIATGAVGADETGSRPAVRATVPVEAGICEGDNVPGDGTPVVPSFLFEDFDTDALHVTSPVGGPCAESTRLTATRTGVYVITAGIAWNNVAGGVRYLAVRKNGNDSLILGQLANSSRGPRRQTRAVGLDLGRAGRGRLRRGARRADLRYGGNRLLDRVGDQLRDGLAVALTHLRPVATLRRSARPGRSWQPGSGPGTVRSA